MQKIMVYEDITTFGQYVYTTDMGVQIWGGNSPVTEKAVAEFFERDIDHITVVRRSEVVCF